MASPYEVLRVDPDADEGEIVAAYRERVKETHPDQGGTVEEFQRVRAAYEAIQSGETEAWDESEPESGSGQTAEAQRPQPTRVEFLNYDALSDHDVAFGTDDVFERASVAGLDASDYGEFVVQPHESLLEAAENNGLTWPFACRGGACANCAVAVCDGKLAQPVDTILPDDLHDRGFRLSCNGIPITDELQVIYNVKHLPGLDELRLPPGPFELAHADD